LYYLREQYTKFDDRERRFYSTHTSSLGGWYGRTVRLGGGAIPRSAQVLAQLQGVHAYDRGRVLRYRRARAGAAISAGRSAAAEMLREAFPQDMPL
jgi:hypothetical protein